MELQRAVDKQEELQQRIQATGYHYVALDLGGFRSGSLNESLNAEQIQVVNVHTP